MLAGMVCALYLHMATTEQRPMHGYIAVGISEYNPRRIVSPTWSCPYGDLQIMSEQIYIPYQLL